MIGRGRGIRYFKTKPTVPAEGCGPLCVFRTRKDAAAFRGGVPDLRIFECQYRPSSKRSVWCRASSDLFHERTPLCDLPPGKALAEWVQLGKEVREWTVERITE